MYLKLDTLTPCAESEIRAAFPNTSFPQLFVAPEGYAVLFAAPQPSFDPITQAVRQGDPVLTDKGHWEQTWTVVDLDADAIAANKAAQAAARKTAILAELASIDTKSIRALREGHRARIDALEEQAQALRQELAAL
jgi:hypothetical protein